METADKQQFLNRWEKQRELGMSRFLLRRGILHAFIFLVIISGVELMDSSFNEVLDKHVFSWRPLLFVVLGFLVSWFNWLLMERMYRRIKSGR